VRSIQAIRRVTFIQADFNLSRLPYDGFFLAASRGNVFPVVDGFDRVVATPRRGLMESIAVVMQSIKVVAICIASPSRLVPGLSSVFRDSAPQ
jgi:hypothetical protein